MINSRIFSFGVCMLTVFTPLSALADTTESAFKLHNLTLQADSLIDNTPGIFQPNISGFSGSPFTGLIMQARDINPNHPETLYLEGLFSESMNKPDFAEGAFLQAIYLAPAFERAYVRLINLYLQQNQLVKAQQMIRPLIDIAGPSTDTQFLMAVILYKKGQLQEAKTIFDNLETSTDYSPHFSALKAQYKPLMDDCEKLLGQKTFSETSNIHP